MKDNHVTETAAFKLSSMVCASVGWSILGLYILYSLVLGSQNGVSSLSYAVLGLISVASGIILQWNLSLGVSAFLYRCFISICMGICVAGIVGIVGSLFS